MNTIGTIHKNRDIILNIIYIMTNARRGWKVAEIRRSKRKTKISQLSFWQTFLIFWEINKRSRGDEGREKIFWREGEGEQLTGKNPPKIKA